MNLAPALLLLRGIGLQFEPDPQTRAKVEALVRDLGSDSTQAQARRGLVESDPAAYQYLKSLDRAKLSARACTLLDGVLRAMEKKLGIWTFDPEKRAREHLERTPRPTIAALGGDRRRLVPPLVGEKKEESLREMFPDHRFFEFRRPIFSGRPNPKHYAVVSIEGIVRELQIFVDSGVDADARAFFAACAPAKEMPLEARAKKMVDAYLVLAGAKPADHKVERTPEGSQVSSRGLIMGFGVRGVLVTMSFRGE